MTIPVSAPSFYLEAAKHSVYTVDPVVWYLYSNSDLPFFSYVTMGKLLNFSMYQFPH